MYLRLESACYDLHPTTEIYESHFDEALTIEVELLYLLALERRGTSLWRGRTRICLICLLNMPD